MKRNLLGYMLCVFILLECFPQLAIAASEQEGERYKVAICDWMILKRQKIGSFQLVHELNGDGVELDMGSLGKRRTSIISCVILIFNNCFVKRHGNSNWKFLLSLCPVSMVSLFWTELIIRNW